ncbi:MAG: polyprenol monophosphomannose synthase [Patescibacteria group bacterium]|nr:polyprenol monophosphomannose synthase [Patescibacteria group bacterium]
MKVSLVVPTLNESGSVSELFRGLDSAAAELPSGWEFEVIVVDDGSTDGTPEIVRSLPSGFTKKVIERKERGLATAVLRGFAEAEGDVLGVIDADLSHPTHKLPELLRRLENNELVVASRNIPGGEVEEWPWYRRFMSWFATLLTRPLGIRVSDPMSGYFFLRRRVFERAEFSPLGYKILLEILVKAKVTSVAEVPYVFRNREVGKSKMGSRETVNYLRHLAKLYSWKVLG